MILRVFEHPSFPDHALLDSGEGEKLERFGPVVLRRPDPQALWRKLRTPSEWEAADLSFERESDRGGSWRPRRGAHPSARGAEPQWPCRFGTGTFFVRPTPFKHVGLFPEQAGNWRFLLAAREQLCGATTGEAPRLLNLFGYTGAASVLARQAGFEVTHVDASRLALAWLGDNAEVSGLGRDSMRLICDDALAFAQRETRRGGRYHAILLDPPHYGRGPKGEKWQFERGVAALVAAARELLEERALLILSTYAIGYSPLALAGLLSELEGGELQVGELALPEEGPAERTRLLPAGFCARWWRGFEHPEHPGAGA